VLWGFTEDVAVTPVAAVMVFVMLALTVPETLAKTAALASAVNEIPAVAATEPPESARKDPWMVRPVPFTTA
jgi:hypothetical protein